MELAEVVTARRAMTRPCSRVRFENQGSAEPCVCRTSTINKKAKLRAPLTDVYRRTSKLQQMTIHGECDTVRHPPPSSIIAWPVLIPEEYHESLALHRPEPLVILAHYAANSHHYSDVCILGGEEKFLVESIARHVGPGWDSR